MFRQRLRSVVKRVYRAAVREAGLASVELFSASLAAVRLPRGAIRVCIGLRGFCSLVIYRTGGRAFGVESLASVGADARPTLTPAAPLPCDRTRCLQSLLKSEWLQQVATAN